MSEFSESRDVFDMVRDGDVDSLRVTLQENPSLADSSFDGASLLHSACFPPQEEIVRLLLEMGCAVNAFDADGDTPLHIVSYGEGTVLMDILLAAGATVNVRNNEGITPLMHAAKQGGEGVQKLIDAGADVMAVDEHGRSALHWAMTGSHDDVKVAELLLARGVSPTLQNMIGDTPLQYAKSMNKHGMLKVLEQSIAAHT